MKWHDTEVTTLLNIYARTQKQLNQNSGRKLKREKGSINYATPISCWETLISQRMPLTAPRHTSTIQLRPQLSEKHTISGDSTTHGDTPILATRSLPTVQPPTTYPLSPASIGYTPPLESRNTPPTGNTTPHPYRLAHWLVSVKFAPLDAALYRKGPMDLEHHLPTK